MGMFILGCIIGGTLSVFVMAILIGGNKNSQDDEYFKNKK